GGAGAFFVTDARGGRVVPLADADSAYRLLVEAMPEGAAILAPSGIVVYANRSLARMLGVPLTKVAGSTLGRYLNERSRPLFETMVSEGCTGSAGGELVVGRDDGTSVVLQVSLDPMALRGEDAICLVAVDMTERHRIEARLRSLSLTDELTGLYNARGFFAVADQQARIAHRAGSKLLVAFADVDGLKEINDTLGHGEGSHALMDVAVILRQTCREADLISRIGGDEFAILGMVGSEDDARRLVERIGAQIDAHNLGAGRPYRLDVSVGTIVHDGVPPFSVSDLLQRADMAMYDVKRSKPDRKNVNPRTLAHGSHTAWPRPSEWIEGADGSRFAPGLPDTD
ncbi:MAG: sensor domain-containing diguanylate cyclase, partial [Chloroflexota bacterium]